MTAVEYALELHNHERLVYLLDQIGCDYDWFDYFDMFETREHGRQKVREDLAFPGTRDLILAWLQDVAKERPDLAANCIDAENLMYVLFKKGE